MIWRSDGALLALRAPEIHLKAGKSSHLAICRGQHEVSFQRASSAFWEADIGTCQSTSGLSRLPWSCWRSRPRNTIRACTTTGSAGRDRTGAWCISPALATSVARWSAADMQNAGTGTGRVIAANERPGTPCLKSGRNFGFFSRRRSSARSCLLSADSRCSRSSGCS